MRPFNSVLHILALAGTLTLALSAHGTTIIGMDIDEVAQQAEMIFEGEVIQSQALEDTNTGIINTYITFRIIDLIKGDTVGENLELKFAGGELNGEIVEVSGSTLPRLGENGIYFVESVSEDMLNPLLGWSQGHFLINTEQGQRRVHTVSNNPVTQVQSVSNIPRSIKAPAELIQDDEGIAAGVTVQPRARSTSEALSADEFKRQIRTMFDN
ncbi:MAG: hypothetical protein AB8B95_00090 [Pseudohongiellaceae bacterium]